MPDENIMQMQREAAERVRQMHARARSFSDEPVRPHMPVPRDSLPQTGANTAVTAAKTPSGLGNSFLSGLFQEQDQLLLLMLAIILAKNEAPMELILALLYIAM